MLHTRPPHFLPLTWMFNSLAHSYLLFVDVMPVLCNQYVYIADEVVSIIRCAVHLCHLKRESPVFSTPLDSSRCQRSTTTVVLSELPLHIDVAFIFWRLYHFIARQHRKCRNNKGRLD